jgi:hypothetical protein
MVLMRFGAEGGQTLKRMETMRSTVDQTPRAA